MRKAVLLLLVVMLVSSCSFFKSENKGSKSKETVSDNKTSLVEINGRVYYDKDFFNYAGVVINELNPNDYNNKEIKDKLLRDFIEYNLLLQSAEQENIKIDENRLNSILELISSDEGSQVLRVYSGSYDTDPDVVKKQLRDKLMVEEYIYSKINSEIMIPEDKIKEAYKDKYEKSVPLRRAQLYQIFTTDKSVAEKAMAELKRGIAFTEVAGRYSEGPEKENGGDLGMIAEDDYPEIFGEAFKLKPGKYSGIIRSEYGYHIFLVKKYDRTKKQTYNQAKDTIHFSLYNQEQDAKFKELVDELYKNAEIKYINDIDFSKFTAGSKGRSSR